MAIAIIGGALSGLLISSINILKQETPVVALYDDAPIWRDAELEELEDMELQQSNHSGNDKEPEREVSMV